MMARTEVDADPTTGMPTVTYDRTSGEMTDRKTGTFRVLLPRPCCLALAPQVPNAAPARGPWGLGR